MFVDAVSKRQSSQVQICEHVEEQEVYLFNATVTALTTLALSLSLTMKLCGIKKIPMSGCHLQGF